MALSDCFCVLSATIADTMRLGDKANEARLLAHDLPRPTRSGARAAPFSLASFLKPNIDAAAYTADIPLSEPTQLPTLI